MIRMCDMCVMFLVVVCITSVFMNSSISLCVNVDVCSTVCVNVFSQNVLNVLICLCACALGRHIYVGICGGRRICVSACVCVGGR